MRQVNGRGQIQFGKLTEVSEQGHKDVSFRGEKFPALQWRHFSVRCHLASWTFRVGSVDSFGGVLIEGSQIFKSVAMKKILLVVYQAI